MSTMNTDEYGNKFWSNSYGQRHRTDGPAVEWVNGGKYWYLNGQFHRTDGPAVEWVNGGKEWWVNGIRHRTDGPAVEWGNGDKYWWVNDKGVSKSKVEDLILQRDLGVIILSRVINPFCEVNVAKYVL
jgi:hypothetical protein